MHTPHTTNGPAHWTWQLHTASCPPWFPPHHPTRRDAGASRSRSRHGRYGQLTSLTDLLPASAVDGGAGPGADVDAELAAEDRPEYAADGEGETPDDGPSTPPTPAAVVASGAVDVAIGTVATSGVFPPVTGESDGLARLLAAATLVDAAMVQLLACTATLDASGEVEQLTGLSTRQWLGLATGLTTMDRRMLTRAGRLLDRLPALAQAVATGAVSWSQLRTITLAARQLPNGIDERLDAFIAAALDRCAGADPDTLPTLIRRAVDELAAQVEPNTDPAPGNRLTLQPNLEGTGGRLYGELDTVGLAILDDATAPTRNQLDHPGGVAAARADNLLTRLLTTPCHHDHPAGDDEDREVSDLDGHDGDTGDLDGLDGDTGTRDGDGRPPCGPLPPVRLLLRMEYASLLGADAVPADILTRLVGGRLALTATHARRLLDQRGFELRTIIVDDGHVIGVGRGTARPPDWLTDAALTIHDTCTSPGCQRPARGADLDHATPWWTPPNTTPGGTDIDNLAPLCPATNRDKEAAGWQVTQDDTGTRRWHHPRSGLTTTTIPTTWRPPGWRTTHPPPPKPPPATADTDSHPPGHDPPPEAHPPGHAPPPDGHTTPPPPAPPSPPPDDDPF